ncbi:MAG TPA: VCBS repeat-containing protein [Symbiobacteriaceae bacterium]|nr:VCBS repeat-containing protein [Symbiobacteriaceae bacterium]
MQFRLASARYLLAALALTVMLAGCAGVSAPAPQGEPPISPATHVSGLMDLANPNALSLAQITEGFREYLNSGSGPVGPRLTALFAHWNLRPVPNSTLVLDADLDGDGTAETVAVYRDTKSATGAMGSLFVISGKAGQYTVDRSAEEVLMPALYTVADLNQDGRPEIVWSTTSIGANTTTSQIYLSAWSPGSLQTQRGEVTMTNVTNIAAREQELVLTGGTKGGFGAGAAQRSQVARYTWAGGALKLSDKQFAASEYSYHKLQDGLVAEELGKRKEAGAAYAAATEPNRQVLPPGDAVPDEWREKLADAVRTFSQLRIALLQIDSQTPAEFVHKVLGGSWGRYEGLTKSALAAKDRQGVCSAAVKWAEANPEFIQALNSPRGYANPQWKPADLCGPMPAF